MGSFVSKFMKNCCAIFKNSSCYSSCCDGSTEIEFENKNQEKDRTMNINCCWGCLEIHRRSDIHSHHKNT